MFECFLSKKETPKRRKIENLVYKALKTSPNFCFKVLRAFAIRELNKDISNWVTKNSSYKSKHPITYRIDSTLSSKKYSNEMPEVKKLYDYVNCCYIKTHKIYLSVVSIGDKDYIVDFLLVKKDTEGSNNVAKKLITRLLRIIVERNTFLHYCKLSLDGAWGNGIMINWLHKKGFECIALKSNGRDKIYYNTSCELRLKEFEDFLIYHKSDSFKPFNKIHGLFCDYISINVTLVNSGFPIRLILLRFKSSNRNTPYRYLMLMSLTLEDSNIYDYQVVKCYKYRWFVEDMIRFSKQTLDITKYSYHSSDTSNIEMFLSLRCCLYMVLNWYRVEYCRPSITSLYKVGLQFEDYFNNIGFRSIWKLFSG